MIHVLTFLRHFFYGLCHVRSCYNSYQIYFSNSYRKKILHVIGRRKFAFSTSYQQVPEGRASRSSISFLLEAALDLSSFKLISRPVFSSL